MDSNTQTTINQGNSGGDDETLKLIEKVGIKFFGYDENGITLVIAPNGQIVQIGIAYNFVKSQISKTNEIASSSAGVESINNLPSLPVQRVDSNKENINEFSPEKGVETLKQQTDSNIELQKYNNDLQIRPEAPKVNALSLTNPDIAFGDTMKLPFHPSEVNKVLNFVKSNSKKSKKTTAKWLSEQFKKFLDEQRLGLVG